MFPDRGKFNCISQAFIGLNCCYSDLINTFGNTKSQFNNIYATIRLPNMSEIRTETLIANQGDDIDIKHLCIDEHGGDDTFAKIIGYIEDIILEENFIRLHTNFLENHWREFDTIDENKLTYTDIFKEYIETIEKYIESQLEESIVGFSMSDFEMELKKRQNELDGQIFEILETFSDFSSFKNMILDYKQMKEGRLADFSKDISVTKYILENDEDI